MKPVLLAFLMLAGACEADGPDACADCCTQVAGLDESAACTWVCHEWQRVTGADYEQVTERCERLQEAGRRHVRKAPEPCTHGNGRGGK